MDNPGLQPPITPPPPLTPPPVPPVPPPPPPPEPIKEEPIIQPPPNPTVKKAKKFLPKLAVGTLVMALLIGGLVLGGDLLREQQRPVEKKASYLCDMCMQDCLEHFDQVHCEGICESACGGGGGGGCDTSSTTAAECRGKAVGYVIDSNWTGTCQTGFTIPCSANQHKELVCERTTGTLCAADCVCESGGGGGGGTICGDGCVKYVCPYGDTNSDGKCDEKDCGVSWNFYENNGCPGISCGSDCCQIDYTQNRTYCQPPDHKEISWNCTVLPEPCVPPSSPSPSPSLSPSASCTIQGYKVIMPGNQKIEPAARQIVTLAGDGTRTANPYYFSNEPPGSKTVSVSTPGGYTVGYTLCINSTTCHTGSATPGSSVTFDCPAGNYPADGYADLWWHYTPTVSCVDLTASPAPALTQTVIFTCEATFTSTNPTAYFRYSTNGGTTWDNTNPPIEVPVDLITHKANYSMTIAQSGNWIVQCKVCTDQSATSCTTWGQAN